MVRVAKRHDIKRISISLHIGCICVYYKWKINHINLHNTFITMESSFAELVRRGLDPSHLSTVSSSSGSGWNVSNDVTLVEFEISVACREKQKNIKTCTIEKHMQLIRLNGKKFLGKEK